jgi:adenylate kinase
VALNLIMLGAPGAGKGTQADRIAAGRGIPKVSTGDILREAVKAGTEIGRRAKAIMDRGELVPDDVVIAIVRERLDRDDARAGFILDGFPRTVAQAQALDGLFVGRDPFIIIDVAVPEAELVRRLTTRLVCSKCGANADPGAANQTSCPRCSGPLVQRADDNQATVLQRLKVYERDTKPLLDYYRTRPTFRAINGAQAPDRVAADVMTAIDALAGGAAASGGGAA